MAVYVDSAMIGYGRMKMSHMVADTIDELDAMADAIGVQRRWKQKAGTCYEHYDVCASKRQVAISLGAIEVESRELVRVFKAKRR